MLTYITAFIFYTLAMVGIMLIGFVVYKKAFMPNKNEAKGTMKILDSLQIAPKKNLLVVRIKNEKFLIASGVEHTTFLAKLQDDNNGTKSIIKEVLQKPQFKAALQSENTFVPQQENQAFQYPQNNTNLNPVNNQVPLNNVVSANIPQVNNVAQMNNYNSEKFDEMYAAEQAQRHYSELQQARLDKIQKQFRQLYEGSNKNLDQEQKPLTRKAMIRQLLRDLNETTSAKAGNGFN